MAAVPPEPNQPARGGRTRASAEQRAEAARRVLDDDASVAEVARSVGVHPSTVRRWVREATATGTAAGAAPGPPVEAEPRGRSPGATRGGSQGAKEGSASAETVEQPMAPPRALGREASVDGRAAVLPEGAATTPPTVQAENEARATSVGHAAEPPGTIDPDRIIPIVDRLRSTHRYVIVVAAWALMLTVSTLLPRPSTLLGVLQFGHLLGLALAVGAVAVIDWHGILWLTHRRQLRETARIAAAVSPLIWAGLVLLGLTGAALKPDLTAVIAWVKMVAVLVVALNGVAASETRQVLRRVTDGVTFDALPRVLAVRMVASAVISQLAWLTTVVIGVTTNLSRS